jgi:hypothetical protein
MKTFLLAIAAMLFISVTGVRAQSNGASQDRDVNIPFTINDLCCDDVITGSSTVHMVVNKNGIHINNNGMTGVGTSGAVYNGNAVAKLTGTSNDNGTTTVSFVWDAVLTSSNGCKVKLHMNTQITINANGDVTANVSNISTECTDLL